MRFFFTSYVCQMNWKESGLVNEMLLCSMHTSSENSGRTLRRKKCGCTMGFFLIASSLWILDLWEVCNSWDAHSREPHWMLLVVSYWEIVVGMLYTMFGHQATDCPVFCKVMTSCFGKIRNLTPSQTGALWGVQTPVSEVEWLAS